MAIADGDVSVAANGDIRWTGAATTTYTVLELHRWLQDKADNASYTGNDILDITDLTPSDRSTDNIITLNAPFNIDADLAQQLYDGSITQGGGDEIFSGLRVLGAVNNSSTQLMVIQNNALYDDTVHTPSAPFWGDQSTGGLNGDAAAGILMRCLIRSRTAGADIDGKRIRVQARHWGDSYDFFNVTLGQGESVAAISTTPDAQNTTTQGTVTAYTHVTNTEGFQTIDLNNGNGAKQYYSKWTYGADTSGDGLKGIWEFTKDLTGNGTAKTIHGLNGELFLGITHSVAYDGQTVNYTENDIISWGTGATAGTGLLLADDDQGATGTLYFQLLTGVAPADELAISDEGTGDGTSNGAAVAQTVPKHFLGSYTGSIIGAYGIGIDAGDLTEVDSIDPLNDVVQTPPNNVTFSVTALTYEVTNPDYVLVGPRSAGVLQTDQLSLEASPYTGGETTVTMSAAIPADTPSAGSFRVFDGSSFVKVTYTGYSGADFTGCTGMPAASASADAFISYIDQAATDTAAADSEEIVSFTTIYSSGLGDRDLFVRVRDGGSTPIKTFETPATLSSAGGSVAAIRTSDA
jgi:hypothetical protein